MSWRNRKLVTMAESSTSTATLSTSTSTTTKCRQNKAVHRRTACAVYPIENQLSVLVDGRRSGFGDIVLVLRQQPVLVLLLESRSPSSTTIDLTFSAYQSTAWPNPARSTMRRSSTTTAMLRTYPKTGSGSRQDFRTVTGKAEIIDEFRYT